MEEKIVQSENNTFLKVICYLSMFSNGFNAFGSVSKAITYKDKTEVAQAVNQSNDVVVQFESNMTGLDTVSEDYIQSFIVQASDFFDVYYLNIVNINALDFVAHIIGFAGAFLMLRLMKKGFYLYLLSQLLLWVCLMIFIPMNDIGVSWFILQVLLSTIFIVVYLTQFKRFKYQ